MRLRGNCCDKAKSRLPAAQLIMQKNTLRQLSLRHVLVFS